MEHLTTENVTAAARFVDGGARLLDRRRFAHLFGDGDAEAVHTALAPYAHPPPDHHP
jgi:hypothetical protein